MMRRGTAWLLALTLIAGGVATASARPLVVAHRGGAGLWPENSLLAFRNAMALGVDALEFDLHLTRDGELVVIHDPTLDRTTTLSGAVDERTLEEIKQARLKRRDGQVTDEQVPTFSEVLDVAATGTADLVPEIKVGRHGVSYPGIEEKVVSLLRTRGLLARATIQAFQPETIHRLRALAPDVRTMFLVSRYQLIAAPSTDAVQRARDTRATDLGIDFHLIDASVIAAAHAAGIRLAAWTVNDERDIRRMIDLGVDGVISDRPDVVKRLVRGRS